LKLKKTLSLLVVGLIVFETVAMVTVRIFGNSMGFSFVAGLSNAMILIRIVNIVLGGLLVVASLCAGKIKGSSIVPIVATAVELLLSMVVIVIPMQFLKMMSVSPEVLDIAAQGIRFAGLGMLVGMVLSVLMGLFTGKKRIVWPLVVIAAVAALSIVMYYVMLFKLWMGTVSMFAIGFLQPFAFLLPAFASESKECVSVEKPKNAAPAAQANGNQDYSYLEAYKNKRK